MLPVEVSEVSEVTQVRMMRSHTEETRVDLYASRTLGFSKADAGLKLWAGGFVGPCGADRVFSALACSSWPIIMCSQPPSFPCKMAIDVAAAALQLGPRSLVLFIALCRCLARLKMRGADSEGKRSYCCDALKSCNASVRIILVPKIEINTNNDPEEGKKISYVR
jgi:hypothetical protein